MEGGPLRAILEWLAADSDVRNAATKFLALTQYPFELRLEDIQYIAERQVSRKNAWWKSFRGGDTESRFLSVLGMILEERYLYHGATTWNPANRHPRAIVRFLESLAPS